MTDRKPFEQARFRRYVLPIVVAATLLVNGAVVASLGIRRGADTIGYDDGARRILAGQPFIHKQASYAAFNAVLAFCFAIGGSYTALIVLQILASAAAAVAVFKLAEELFGVPEAIVASLLFVMNLDHTRWHSYVLTDSLYSSFVVIAVLAIERARQNSNAWQLLALVLLAFVALLRPNGWIVVLVAVLYWSREYGKTREWRRSAIAAVAAGIVAVFLVLAVSVPSFRKGIETESPARWLRKGTVIWGSDAWRVPMPEEIGAQGDWVSGLGYAARHPVASARLAVTRVAVELAGARPYYSGIHNVVVLGFRILICLLALYGWRRARMPGLALVLGVIAGHLVIVALTFADYDGRFALYVTPLIGILAGAGAIRLVERFRPNRHPLKV